MQTEWACLSSGRDIVTEIWTCHTQICRDVTQCHLGDETIAVNAVVMNKLGKSRKPRLGSDKILKKKN